MKRILYITAFPPCQKTGGQQFSLNAIRELSQKYIVDVWYFSYPEHSCEIYSDTDSLTSDHGIANICDFQIQHYDFIKRFWIHPLFTRRFNRKILHKIQSVSSDYDILYFDFSQVALYSLHVKHPHKVLRMHDVMFQKFSRKNPLMAKWVTGTERKIVRSFEKVFVPSIKDADLLNRVYGVNAFYTNEYLKPVDFTATVEQKKQFVFYGYWKRSENTDGLIWFVQKVLPLLKGKYEFIVIGGGLDSQKQQSAKYFESIYNNHHLLEQIENFGGNNQ